MKANHPVDSSMAKGFDATSKLARRPEQPMVLQPAVDAEQIQQQQKLTEGGGEIDFQARSRILGLCWAINSCLLRSGREAISLP